MNNFRIGSLKQNVFQEILIIFTRINRVIRILLYNVLTCSLYCQNYTLVPLIFQDALVYLDQSYLSILLFH